VSGPLEAAETPADIERFNWPDPEEWELTGIREQALAWKDYPILCGSYEPFYLYSRMRGMERALTDLLDRPRSPRRRSTASIAFTNACSSAFLRRPAI